MDKIFCENLKSIRKERGLSQKQVSLKLGVVESCYANWEQGRTEPSLKDLIDLADFFECSIDYLVGRENDFGQVVVMKEVSDEQKKIWCQFDNLTKDKQKVLLELLSILKD